MSNGEVNLARRRFLIGATSVVGGAGVVGAAVPFLASWQPSAKAKALGAPVRADVSKLRPRRDPRAPARVAGKPIFVVKRTDAMLNQLEALEPMLCRSRQCPAVSAARLRGKPLARSGRAQRPLRSYRHLHPPGVLAEVLPGSRPPGLRWKLAGGLFLPLPWLKFDLSGRVYAGVPAPRISRCRLIPLNPMRSC